MPITKVAVKAFLDKPRRDLRTLKKLSDDRLQERVEELPVRPPLFKRLRHEQKVCFLIGAKYRYAGFLLDTGMGKTLLSLSLIRYFNVLGKVKCVLVLVPNRSNKTEWLREVRKHQDAGMLPEDFTARMLNGSSVQKWKQLEDGDELILVETYAGLTRMVCTLVPPKKKGGKNKLKPDPKLIKRLCKLIDGLIMDESTFVKNHKALPYRICRQIRKTAYMAFALTGTPFGRDPVDLWAQMYLVDNGETLGTTLGMFREALFKSKEDHWGHVTYDFDKKNEDKLNRLLAHSSIQYEVDESDLPALIPIRKYVSLPDDADELYQAARRQLLAAKGHFRETNNAFLRMRQISSGYVGYNDDDLGKRAEFEFSFNPKRDLLLSLIDEIRPDRKIIVFVEFVFSGSMIGRELEKKKVNFAHLWGGTKDPEATLAKFKDDPACRVLILNNQAGGFGLNLKMAKYGIYYESPVSPIIRKQTRRRFERQGSDHSKVFQYDLITRGTMDDAILKWHAEGEGLFDAIIRGKATI
jgi:SNF2 family DNA or RNA helicase